MGCPSTRADNQAQITAERVGQSMIASSPVIHDLGSELLEIGPGRARAVITVRDDMANCHGICHGGILFTFADITFGFACNSRNERVVAAGAEINYLRPALLGDRLTAEARETERKGRNGIYDVKIVNQAGETIALFRGRSRIIAGQHF